MLDRGILEILMGLKETITEAPIITLENIKIEDQIEIIPHKEAGICIARLNFQFIHNC